MSEFENEQYQGERALFMIKDALVSSCRFLDGESPLKEGKNLKIENCTFVEAKYPLWYCTDLEVKGGLLDVGARAGFWYDKNLKVRHLTSFAPKGFRVIEGMDLKDCTFKDASETFWHVTNFKVENLSFHGGQYTFMQCKKGHIKNLDLEGDYIFDGVEDLLVEDSLIHGKDAFWNSKNVTVKRSKISGQYLAWNAKNLTLIDCEISSHQGLCYIEGLKMVNCKLTDTDLCFEYCSGIDADIVDEIVSVKNPISGKIKAKGYKEKIFDDSRIDPNQTELALG